MTKRNRLKKSLVAASFMALLVANQAGAALVNFTVDGIITSAVTSNGFNLSVGEQINASGQFDDSSIIFDATLGDYIDFTSSINNMSITFGNTTYTDAMDVYDGAKMYFNGGVFDGIDYASINNDPAFDSWGHVGGTAGNEDFTGTGIAGNWNASSYQVSAVPVPAAVWLFGTGIALLAGIGRRNQKVMSAQ